ncbi:hypothetical protein M431DRAFT_495249 [Trichoderma harzianum CBS 226.95]|uniref:Uncharacterized protein n=1 Tax=Trichoderma harzianum CBS 226.95 TaxID=983964 RepID=A0A2T4AD48_TRIHA|nr:hypothetical protein M431DRAFT_495249 [Trichoderma harzianum CBS 226.95]PTB55014.1 hypothetical protein M431DRAFT_495249 [Trichoderma harzianum CBS 226.95]
MDLRKRWKGYAEVVSLIGFAGVTAQDETMQKETRSRKRKENIIRNREMRQDIQLTLDAVRWPDWSLARVDAVICPPSRFGLAPGIGAAFTSITARIQFGRAGVYEHGECLQCHEPRYEWQGALCKITITASSGPRTRRILRAFSSYKTSSSHQMLFCAVPARPAEAPLETGKAQSRVNQQQRVSTEAESETDPVAGDDALAYIRRRAVQPSPTSLHMQGISSTRTSTYS